MKIGIIGLGYVGLPLAVAFCQKGYNVIGYDTDKKRVQELNDKLDSTGEIADSTLSKLKSLVFTALLERISNCEIYIITVPTPVNKYNIPDLSPLKQASRSVGKILTKNNIVIYESTVYPGCTEEECVPELEQASGLKFNQDFFVGYSPERINPSDSHRKLTDIIKVTSGSTSEVSHRIDALYKDIITAGTCQVSSIKVAEASKVIENAQRDLNIAFVNELAIIFKRIGLDTLEVLKAAGTKWNFLPFRPGLVGGHCIGVDPYYLTYKAESLGYHPEVILAGRRVNNNMPVYITNRIIKLIVQRGHHVKHARILLLGITFKENCPDIRNSKVIDVAKELESFGTEVFIYDPQVKRAEIQQKYNLKLIDKLEANYTAVVLAVGHTCFRDLLLKDLLCENGIIFDIKGFYNRTLVDDRL